MQNSLYQSLRKFKMGLMMQDSKHDLQARIERLERKVENLEQHISGLKNQGSPAGKASPDQSGGEEPIVPKSHRWDAENFQPGEQWLNRIGIGLLLIGVAFLFKYSIDQGWLIPPVRSAIGLGIGLVLFISGLQVPDSAKPMKQILLGGGIATFYVTGFSTFQLYSFAPVIVTWFFMVVVTLLALSLSLQQNEAVLSIVGTLGALGTPFMLYTGEGGVIMLMLYTALVLAGSSAVYLFKGWKGLLWSITVGGFVVLCIGVVNTIFGTGTVTLTERWFLLAGVVIWSIASWMLATGRAVMTLRNPRLWPDPEMLLKDGSIDPNMNYSPGSSVHLMVFLVPLLMLPLVIGIWDLSMDGAGSVAFVLAGLGVLMYLFLRKESVSKLASTHIFMALIMLTIGFVLLLEGNILFAVLAAEAVALRYVAYSTADDKVDISSHILFGVVIVWLFNMMRFSAVGSSAVVDLEKITQLAFLAAGGILLPRWIRKPDISLVYRVVCHILFLVWIYHFISPLENGQAWTTVAWGAYGIFLLILGFVKYGRRIRLAGMSTIFLVVGKLFLVDLSQLQAIWRILLFIGFGAVFLVLGYYWQKRIGEDSTGMDSNN
ncbi:MAG: DUF2339 domain-containing protein [Balneolaceae bacterium]